MLFPVEIHYLGIPYKISISLFSDSLGINYLEDEQWGHHFEVFHFPST